MQMVLEKEAEVNAHSERCGNILQAASSGGHVQILTELEAFTLLQFLKLFRSSLKKVCHIPPTMTVTSYLSVYCFLRDQRWCFVVGSETQQMTGWINLCLRALATFQLVLT